MSERTLSRNPKSSNAASGGAQPRRRRSDRGDPESLDGPDALIDATGRQIAEVRERRVPVRFDPRAIPRSPAGWRKRIEAEHRLHGLICTPRDWTRCGLGDWRAHGPDECEWSCRWTFLEKQRGGLLWQYECACGLRRNPMPDYFTPGKIVLTEINPSSARGRPPVKRAWYDLASAYALSVAEFSGRVPRGAYPAIALHLSAPWFGVRLSADEVKTEAARIAAALRTRAGVLRYEISTRCQWGDRLSGASMSTGLPPAEAAARFPQAWHGR